MTCSDVRELKEARARIVELELERDELLAHCEIARIEIKNAHIEGQKNCGRNPTEFRWEHSQAKLIFDSIQSQSLAEIQAKAIEDMLDMLDGALSDECKSEIIDYINQLRNKQRNKYEN